MVYLSSNNIDKTERGAAIDESVFSSEFINGLKFSGVPNYMLALKVGVPIMLLQNINQANEFCNGTRLQVLKLTRTSIQAQIINGTHFGKKVIIPRLRITPSDKRLPIKIYDRADAEALTLGAGEAEEDVGACPFNRNPNKVLNSIAICSVAVLLFFYCLILGVASLKHKQKISNEHKGVLASAVLATFGVIIAVFIIVRSIYSSTNLMRTQFMKLCLWFLGGISIAAPVLLAIECFGSDHWRCGKGLERVVGGGEKFVEGGDSALW
ncbi:ATP-dependent DNA helicase PIF1-like protein [Tanacetum coccineum]|uniref:ATP-dependent DNA helicase PIF1-like protein n=1 Tax=Tanacetum coccineum TaxID=301880 RepID=A0ABQ5BZW4_9ASTR